MKFDEITVKTNTPGADFLAGELIVNGITSFAINDPRDFLQIIDEKSVPFDYYESDLVPEDADTVSVTVYLTQNAQGRSRREFVLKTAESMKSRPEFGNIEITGSVSDDKDWENNWKEFFHPVKIGEKLIIKPSWEDCDPEGRTVLEIDPESSFGSGRHETTKLCLESIEKLPLAGADVLDMGCGSGILGIAACLLGAKSCVGVDIEENAAEITEKNARINGIPEGTVTALCGNILEDKKLLERIKTKKYDIILSNIVADVLCEMLPIFKDLIKDGGRIVLSGIIAPRKEKVLAALEANSFAVKDVRLENDWTAIDAEKAGK
jgi:ribosomal protein L11 methyltransferase